MRTAEETYEDCRQKWLKGADPFIINWEIEAMKIYAEELSCDFASWIKFTFKGMPVNIHIDELFRRFIIDKRPNK